MSMGISPISGNMSFDPSAMFKKLDANSDGGVTKEEFFANIKKKDGDTDEKLTKMFEETDTDGDGVITESENEAIMQKMSKQGPPPPPPASKTSSSSSTSSTTSSTTTYDVKDTNEDGTVSAEEKLDYIIKLLEEAKNTDSASSEYSQTGQLSGLSSAVSSTFSVSA